MSDLDLEKERFRWELALDARKRANYSADIIRASIFTASGAVIGFLVSLRFHKSEDVMAFLLCLLAVVLVLLSWFLQKHKSIERFNALVEHGLDEFQAREDKLVKRLLRWNSLYDLLAALFLLTAVTLAFFARV